MAIIGKDENNNYVHIGDSERCSGLYVLGKPRMGKSWLLINLITQDILNGHGVFFIDPHADGIQEVINCLPAEQSDRIVLLDPEDPERSFGINPLYCKDIDSLNERNAAYKKTKGLFDKIWKIAFEQTPWLQSLLDPFTLFLAHGLRVALVEHELVGGERS